MTAPTIARVTYGLDIRTAAGDGRTIEGVAVPYNEVSYVTPVGAEMFAAGALAKTAHDWSNARRSLPLLRSHVQTAPIGRVTAMTDTPDGLVITARLADTALGREAAQEVAEGVLSAFSVGVRKIRTGRAGDVTVVREAALHELSLVAVPAYTGAQLLDVRGAGAGWPSRIPDAPTVPERYRRRPIG